MDQVSADEQTKDVEAVHPQSNLREAKVFEIKLIYNPEKDDEQSEFISKMRKLCKKHNIAVIEAGRKECKVCEEKAKDD